MQSSALILYSFCSKDNVLNKTLQQHIALHITHDDRNKQIHKKSKYQKNII